MFMLAYLFGFVGEPVSGSSVLEEDEGVAELDAGLPHSFLVANLRDPLVILRLTQVERVFWKGAHE